MSGRGGKRAVAAREEEESAADDNYAQQPPAKKPTKADNSSSDNSDEIVVCEIGRNRRVTVRKWRGKINVDIREFYSKDGNLLPGKKVVDMKMIGSNRVAIPVYLGKHRDGNPNSRIEFGWDIKTLGLGGGKGITLSLEQWNMLRDHAEEIDKALGHS
ncbi:hypothetical protein SADUNF_Sadunf07G0087700 [Salix dunnii]|uniref:Transcriptional coactivator p15 (PC4) C-terminal domain-containing protein n=1 Tax=Salix dunnii TaxID=1413687 RepID=A0A835K3Y8_9ROSI|nr:hypothetical protein SADUNF_Sadunf07G0087700 [Salix dunnii]